MINIWPPTPDSSSQPLQHAFPWETLFQVQVSQLFFSLGTSKPMLSNAYGCIFNVVVRPLLTWFVKLVKYPDSQFTAIGDRGQ